MKVFNSSHMVPYDLPDISHDMILRFMDVNFSAIADGSARIPSKVGDNVKPVPAVLDGEENSDTSIPVPVGKTPEQDKAMWEGASDHIRFIIALYSELNDIQHIITPDQLHSSWSSSHLQLVSSSSVNEGDGLSMLSLAAKKRAFLSARALALTISILILIERIR